TKLGARKFAESLDFQNRPLGLLDAGSPTDSRDLVPFLDTYRTMCLAPQPEFPRSGDQVHLLVLPSPSDGLCARTLRDVAPNVALNLIEAIKGLGHFDLTI